MKKINNVLYSYLFNKEYISSCFETYDEEYVDLLKEVNVLKKSRSNQSLLMYSAFFEYAFPLLNY